MEGADLGREGSAAGGPEGPDVAATALRVRGPACQRGCRQTPRKAQRRAGEGATREGGSHGLHVQGTVKPGPRGHPNRTRRRRRSAPSLTRAPRPRSLTHSVGMDLTLAASRSPRLGLGLGSGSRTLGLSRRPGSAVRGSGRGT